MTKYYIDEEMKKKLERDFSDYTEERIEAPVFTSSFSDGSYLLEELIDEYHLKTITRGDIIKREHYSGEYKFLSKQGKARYLILLDVVRLFDPNRDITLVCGYNSYSSETIKKDIVRALDTRCSESAVQEYDLGDSYNTIIKRTPLTPQLTKFLVELEDLMYSDLTKNGQEVMFNFFSKEYRSAINSSRFSNLITEALRSYNIAVIPSEFSGTVGYHGLAMTLFNYSTFVRSFTSQVFSELKRLSIKTASTTDELNVDKVFYFNQQRVYASIINIDANTDTTETNKKAVDKLESIWNNERRKYVYDNIQFREDAGRLAKELNKMYDGLNISENQVLHLLTNWYDRTIYYEDSKGGTRITEFIANKIKEFFTENRDMFEVWEYKGSIDFKANNNDLVRINFNKKYGTKLQVMQILGCIRRQIKTGEININEKVELPQNFISNNKVSVDELNIILKGLVPEVGTCSDLLELIRNNPGLTKSGIITGKLKLAKYSSILSKVLDRMVELDLLEVFKGTEYAKRINDNGYFVKGTYKPEYEQLEISGTKQTRQVKENELSVKSDYIAEVATESIIEQPAPVVQQTEQPKKKSLFRRIINAIGRELAEV